MNASDRERLHVVRALSKGGLLQREAAERLGLSVRQVKRLMRFWRADGDKGLVSRQRGRVSPRRLEASKRALIAELLRGKYPDFGATLAAEKLGEREGSRSRARRCVGFRSNWAWRDRDGVAQRACIPRASGGLVLAN